MSKSKSNSMSITKSLANKEVANKEVYLDELEIGVGGSLIVMLCRIWDVNASTGRYLSRDFVVCDAKGNTMHGTARATVAHIFLKLKEGEIYSVKNFSVQPNKEDFRIYKDAPYILEFDGDTVIRKTFVQPDGFIRYPFQLIDLEDLQLTNNKYMIDVAGYVTNVGRSVVVKPGSRTLDFYLANTRGYAVRVTMWGALGDLLIQRRTRCKGVYPIVLTTVSVKTYNGRLYLSSSSSTVILDDNNIPVLKGFRTSESGVEKRKENSAAFIPEEFSTPKAETLENLLMWSRNRKNDAATFYCEVRIDGIRTKRGWSFPSCTGEKCRKQATRNNGSFWCESCNSEVEYPVMRYRLELEVSNSTDRVVVVMFDEVATKVVKYSVDSIMESAAQDEQSDSPIPTALANIIGTTLTLELTAQSYFEHADYESFTCWNIGCAEGTGETGEPANVEPSEPRKKGLVSESPKVPCIVTPSKVSGSKKHVCTDLEDSDAEVSSIAGGNEATSSGAMASNPKRRKSYIVEDSD